MAGLEISAHIEELWVGQGYLKSYRAASLVYP